VAKLSTKPVAPRNMIAMDREDEVKYWTKHFGITKEALQKAVEKVGNSAAAVRKELKTPGARS